MTSEMEAWLKLRAVVFIAAGAFAALAVNLLQAHAAEQATLRNGFAMRCDHHAQVDGRMRLYLSAGEDNYIEFAPSEIATFEVIPDPPAPVEPCTSSHTQRASKIDTSRYARNARARRNGTQS